MPAIRWLDYAGSYLGLDSLIWEFEKDLDHEVSAEWTIKGRPFIIPSKKDGLATGEYIQFGLLLASNAINRRFRCDGGSGGPEKNKKRIPKEWRTISLDSQLLNNKPWECLCKKQYKALIIIKKEPFIICPVEIKEYCQQRNIPILIYQEHFDSGATNEWTLVSYEIRGKKPKKVILENIDMLDKFTK